ncbi:MAG: C69 family dipeptidase, partial [Leptospiraceae bacterium]|nr:C69 family dipeptidase [Leptospiraceae bacterium]
SMCDTFTAGPGYTLDERWIFGKNSDREPNEAQSILRIPAFFPEEKSWNLSFISLPAPKESYEVLLSKPFHLWGAEMGVNEYGLVIGNEAVFTKVGLEKRNDGLTGMDMIRYALQSTKTAEMALECITTLLEKYGQDACGGYRDRNFFYHNSFIITDPEESFVLETVGKHWVAKKIKGYYAISNGLSINDDYEYCNEGLKEFAKSKGFQNGKLPFASSFSDFFFTTFGMCKNRRALNLTRGDEYKGKLGIQEAFSILRTHSHKKEGEEFEPANSKMNSLCLHASGFHTPSQTTASMVVELRKGKDPIIFLTGTASPCISIFKPFFFKTRVLTEGEDSWKEPANSVDDSLWWKGERIHRRVIRNYKALAPSIIKEIKELENLFVKKVRELENASVSERETFSKEALDLSLKKMDEWIQNLETNSISKS